MTDFLYINLTLAFSNLLVFPALILQFYKGNYISFLISMWTAFFSFSYHLVETKFKLKGIQEELGLNSYIKSESYVWIFLNLDRIFAFICVVYHFYFFKHDILNLKNILLLLCLNFISEILGRVNFLNLFLFTHLLWHILAYYFLFVISL